MITRDKIINEYFEWLYNLVCRDRYPKEISFRRLFMSLHSTEFVYSIARDGNRADDGIELRRRFCLENNFDDDLFEYTQDCLDGPCSILEMMIALAIRCEETIMDDTSRGDRTSQWFWEMVVSLGLGSMTDDRFAPDIVDDILDRFLNREYKPNGEGGLFTIRNCEYDLRDVEIWYQLCWYLDSIT